MAYRITNLDTGETYNHIRTAVELLGINRGTLEKYCSRFDGIPFHVKSNGRLFHLSCTFVEEISQTRNYRPIGRTRCLLYGKVRDMEIMHTNVGGEHPVKLRSRTGNIIYTKPEDLIEPYFYDGKTPLEHGIS